jgi:hypothetical protein
MSAGMRSTFVFPAAAPAPRVELALRDREGEPWLLTLSCGMERFIGAYPRLPGFECGGGLLAFRQVDGAR